MSRNDFFNKLNTVLNAREVVLIEYNFLRGNDHKYFKEVYNSGEYQKALNYIIKNRKKLNFDSTPPALWVESSRAVLNYIKQIEPAPV